MGEISDKTFLGFKWPPKMSSYKFKKTANQVWLVLVYPNHHVFTLETPPKQKHVFDSESDARSLKKYLTRCRENPIVIVTSTYDVDEDGYI